MSQAVLPWLETRDNMGSMDGCVVFSYGALCCCCRPQRTVEDGYEELTSEQQHPNETIKYATCVYILQVIKTFQRK